MGAQARGPPPPQTPRRRWALSHLWQRRSRGRLGRFDHGARFIQIQQMASLAAMGSMQTQGQPAPKRGRDTSAAC